ncbi:hypothetical protein IMZ48_34040 [Candidatus Bathyarchaeota archaeon]|nr:hypothetical protein [Candidatus Bathyarchaeota archaeon]
MEPHPPPLCAVTNQPARYRDPKTGLPYYNAYAYREIRRLAGGEFRWSALLGCWVGEGAAAKGVPARFLDPEAPAPAPAPVPEAKEGDGGKGQGEKAGGQSGKTEGAEKENQAGGQSDVAKDVARETQAAPGQQAGAQAQSGGGIAPAPVPAPS